MWNSALKCSPNNLIQHLIYAFQHFSILRTWAEDLCYNEIFIIYILFQFFWSVRAPWEIRRWSKCGPKLKLSLTISKVPVSGQETTLDFFRHLAVPIDRPSEKRFFSGARAKTHRLRPKRAQSLGMCENIGSRRNAVYI